jgi:hypothetical protein
MSMGVFDASGESPPASLDRAHAQQSLSSLRR